MNTAFLQRALAFYIVQSLFEFILHVRFLKDLVGLRQTSSGRREISLNFARMSFLCCKLAGVRYGSDLSTSAHVLELLPGSSFGLPGIHIFDVLLCKTVNPYQLRRCCSVAVRVVHY